MHENGQNNNTVCVFAVELLNYMLPQYSNLGVWCQCSIKKNALQLGRLFLLT